MTLTAAQFLLLWCSVSYPPASASSNHVNCTKFMAQCSEKHPEAYCTVNWLTGATRPLWDVKGKK